VIDKAYKKVTKLTTEHESEGKHESHADGFIRADGSTHAEGSENEGKCFID